MMTCRLQFRFEAPTQDSSLVSAGRNVLSLGKYPYRANLGVLHAPYDQMRRTHGMFLAANGGEFDLLGFAVQGGQP